MGPHYEVDDDFSHESGPEKRLWCAVIYLAVLDARSPSDTTRDAVRSWLTSPDFAKVCELAQQEGKTVHRGLSQILDNPKTGRELRAEHRAAERQAKAERQQALAEAKREMDKLIVELRAEGRPLGEIARIVGTSPTTVAGRIKVLKAA